MKFLLTLLVTLLVSPAALGDCPPYLDVSMTVTVEPGSAVGNHAPLLEVTIAFPQTVEGYAFESMELTYGEVEEFWIPLDHEVIDGKIRANFAVSDHYIAGLELALRYSLGSCTIVSQRLLRN